MGLWRDCFLGVESTWGKKEFFFRNRVFTLGTALEIFSQKQNKTKTDNNNSTVKTLQCRRCRSDPRVTKLPWGRKWLCTPVIFPGNSHGQRSLAGYSPWACKRAKQNWTSKQQQQSTLNTIIWIARLFVLYMNIMKCYNLFHLLNPFIVKHQFLIIVVF